MKNARTIGFGILAAVACTLALAGGCATDEAATCTEGACSESATCAEKSACSEKAACSDKAASECCKNAAAKDAAKN
jgi:hypothetical protein